jgi:hypothetical protein
MEQLEPSAVTEESPGSMKIIGILGIIALLALAATGTSIFFLQKTRREQQGTQDLPGHLEDPETMDQQLTATTSNLTDLSVLPFHHSGSTTGLDRNPDIQLEDPSATEPDSTYPPILPLHPFGSITSQDGTNIGEMDNPGAASTMDPDPPIIPIHPFGPITDIDGTTSTRDMDPTTTLQRLPTSS